MGGPGGQQPVHQGAALAGQRQVLDAAVAVVGASAACWSSAAVRVARKVSKYFTSKLMCGRNHLPRREVRLT
ncbi:hypothetical protein GCM10009678_15390 [Actinomadura kijaniata]